MLHAIVCEVNYATRSGEIVVKNCCVTQIRQREKLVLLNQLIKIRNCLTNPKEYGILTKKSNEQAFDFVTLKTVHGLFISDVVFSCIVYYSLLFYSFLHIKFPFSFWIFRLKRGFSFYLLRLLISTSSFCIDFISSSKEG